MSTRNALKINAGSAIVDVLDHRNPTRPTKFGRLDIVADPAPGSADAADAGGDGDLDGLFVPPGGSFSIWNARTGALVFDSDAQLERLLRTLLPGEFEANPEENDSPGEPERITLGRIEGRLYAFIELERVGGILTLDLTDPFNPEFVDYVDSRRSRGCE